ncbi:MAG: lipoprotein signal peptidase [Actinobacteria bacterium]|nr:lipoprotein signal peptidase [Actinomycetota bacterium]
MNFRQRKWLTITALIVYLLDYSTKFLALHYLSDTPVKVIGNILKFNLTFNSGAAFSLASSGTIFLSSFSLIMVAVIFYFGRRVRSLPWAVALGLVLGGIFGNLSDRIFRSPGGLQGEVIDWIQIPHWPVFNIADSAVVCAAVLITYLSAKNIDFYSDRDQNHRHPNTGKSDG